MQKDLRLIAATHVLIVDTNTYARKVPAEVVDELSKPEPDYGMIIHVPAGLGIAGALLIATKAAAKHSQVLPVKVEDAEDILKELGNRYPPEKIALELSYATSIELQEVASLFADNDPKIPILDIIPKHRCLPRPPTPRGRSP